MIDLPGSDPISALLVYYLDTQSLRAQVVSSNVANADTPGYRAKELDFSDYLKQAATDAVAPANANLLSRASAIGPRLIEQDGAAVGIDGNTVDVGHEMATLAQAGMEYTTGIQLLQSHMRTLRVAIREGR
jgi:flagellar basal-body rod protein FlgB